MAARARRLRYAREGFVDRSYTDDGALVPRGDPDDTITDPASCAAQAVRLARSNKVETLCVTHESPLTLAIARAVRAALDDVGLLRSAT